MTIEDRAIQVVARLEYGGISERSVEHTRKDIEAPGREQRAYRAVLAALHAAVVAEREACARVVEKHDPFDESAEWVLQEVAGMIRARGEED